MDIPKFDLTVIDLDPIVYRAGFAVEKINKEMDIIEVEPLQNAIFNVNSMIKKTCKRLTQAGHVTGLRGYLTASGDNTNFRFDIFPNYKANRKDARRPIYYQELRDYLIDRYQAEIVLGQEADDTCSITHIKAYREGLNSVLCSIDKDFNNVAGWHYNYVTDDLYYITELQALRNKYLQILTGDTSDGIPRIKKGWREKKVAEALFKALTEREMYYIIRDEIETLDDGGDGDILYITDPLKICNDTIRAHNELLARGRLVHLRHFEEELWEPNLNSQKDPPITTQSL